MGDEKFTWQSLVARMGIVRWSSVPLSPRPRYRWAVAGIGASELS